MADIVAIESVTAEQGILLFVSFLNISKFLLSAFKKYCSICFIFFSLFLYNYASFIFLYLKNENSNLLNSRVLLKPVLDFFLYIRFHNRQ